MLNLLTHFRRLDLIIILLLSLTPVISDVIINYNGFAHTLFYLLSRIALFYLMITLLNFVFSFRTVIYIVCSFVFMSLMIELVHLNVFGEFITRQGVIALMETNINEGMAFMRGVEWIIVLLIGAILYLYIAFWKLPTTRLPFVTIKTSMILGVLTIMFFTSLVGQVKEIGRAHV